MKIWVLFFVSLLSLGIGYLLIAWPWAILNALFRSSKQYEQASLDSKSDAVKNKHIKALVRIGVFVHLVFIFIGAVVAGSVFTSLQFGSDIYNSKDLKLTGETPPLLEVVQTDAAVNPGNSGGSLVGDCGAVGVITWMSDSNKLGDYGFASEQGISYAVSSKTVKEALGL